jgi:hypothetical protein
MATKQCTRCGKIKSLSEFSKNKNTADKHSYHCKTCAKRYSSEYYKTNRQKYYKENKDIFTLSRLKTRARTKGLPFNLTIEDITGVTHCPIFGWELKRNQEGKHGNRPNSPSVDRIVPELGYVKGNVQVLSNKANMMKQDATPEELLMFADWVIKTYRK